VGCQIAGSLSYHTESARGLLFHVNDSRELIYPLDRPRSVFDHWFPDRHDPPNPVADAMGGFAPSLHLSLISPVLLIIA
jgi:hypothetical protein